MTFSPRAPTQAMLSCAGVQPFLAAMATSASMRSWLYFMFWGMRGAPGQALEFAGGGKELDTSSWKRANLANPLLSGSEAAC